MAKTVRLNKVARLWVDALRSGKYKQGKGALTLVNHSTGEITGHCCMGVLADLAAKDGVKMSTEVRDGQIFYNGESAVCPLEVQEWAGLKNQNGNIGTTENLTHLNDDGKSFKQIARIIEQKAKELFV